MNVWKCFIPTLILQKNGYTPLCAFLCMAFFFLNNATLGEEQKEPAAPQTYTARALIQSIAELSLTSEISGRLAELPLREGNRFSKGDTLIRFDCHVFKARFKVAKAQLDVARLTLEAVRKRAKLDSAGVYEVGIAEADYNKSQGELEAAKFPVDRCLIRAPFDGRVVELAAHQHETVAQDVPIMSIIDDKNLELKIVVPSHWLSWLEVDAGFTIQIDETGESLSGHVTRLGALVDAVGQSIPAYGTLDETSVRLVAGMSGAVTFQRP